jgi:hypothetical protein
MMYCLVDNSAISGGPWMFESAQIKQHLPDGATDDPVVLVAVGLVRHTYADQFAPLGYLPPVLESGLAVSYPAGTIEERQAAALQQWRETESIPRWKGRAHLASLPAASEGPLAEFNEVTLLAQIDAYMQSVLTPGQWERYQGADPWHRNDSMVAVMAALLGLTDAQVDAWFKEAEAFT